jgi:putative N-acetylmannosamine-6-phosphate epimerase
MLHLAVADESNMSLFNVQIFMTSPSPKPITEFVLTKSAARQNMMSDCSDCDEVLAALMM